MVPHMRALFTLDVDAVFTDNSDRSPRDESNR